MWYVTSLEPNAAKPPIINKTPHIIAFHSLPTPTTRLGMKAAIINQIPTKPLSHPCHGFSLTIAKPAIAAITPTMTSSHIFPVAEKFKKAAMKSQIPIIPSAGFSLFHSTIFTENFKLFLGILLFVISVLLLVFPTPSYLTNNKKSR